MNAPGDRPPDAEPASLATRRGLQESHRRLQHLYEISKLLTRFESVETTVPAIISVVRQAVPLHGAIFLLDTGDRPARKIVWQAEGSGASHRRTARAHARRSYAYLAGAAAARWLELHDERAGTPDSAAEAARDQTHNFIVLPLAILHRPIFGALQVEGVSRLDEMDLTFVNTVVNQLAIAIDRQAAVESRQLAADARSADAEDRQVAAESDRVRAERRQIASQEGQVEAERSRDSARSERDVAERSRAAS